MATHDNGGSFGSCCETLNEAIRGGDDDEEYEPLITISENGVLYMTVGLVEIGSDEPGMMDHPMYFCPFCGTKLQTPEEVLAMDNPVA